MTQRDDTLAGSVFRTVLIPLSTLLVAVLLPILLYVAGSVRSVAAEVQSTSVVIAEIHAEMQGATHRITTLEAEVDDAKEWSQSNRVRIVEIAATIANMR